MITNTVQFRFPVTCPRPSWTEIATFLKQLDVNLMEMETAYKTSQDRSLCIKFTSVEAMKKALKKNKEPKKFLYTNGMSVTVRMSIAGSNIRYVRIFDLPPESSDESLSLALGKFGQVEYMVREKFPSNLGLDHLYTGVRGVYMEVKTEIPPTIDVGLRKGKVFYDGLKDTCFLCEEVGHRKDSCPQRKERNLPVGGKAVRPSSYAAVVSGPPAGTEEQVPLESTDEVIEVLEEELSGQETESSDDQSQPDEYEIDAEQAKEIRRKESIEKLKEVAKAVSEMIGKNNASQRRAQFASSGSKEHSRPKKVCARKQNY